MSCISKYYKDYLTTVSNFNKFHNEVINMPRDAFSSASFAKIRSLASYLLLIENIKEAHSKLSYKEILALIINEIKKGNYPVEENRNLEIEKRYFREDISINELYNREGRMFRHLMETLVFFGVVDSVTKQEKVIKFDVSKEISLADDNLLMSVLRNNWLCDNINSNNHIKNLKSITIKKDADYRPAYAILAYLKKINRAATFFEISVLLGRIDSLQKEEDILNRAFDIAKELPLEQDEQIEYFFNKMNWKNPEGKLFGYKPSQEPFFKFKSFILYMNSFKLLDLVSRDKVALSDYSKQLLEEEIPIELLDLEGLLYKIDDDNQKDSELMDIIINKRTPAINKALEKDSVLVERINKRALRTSCNYDKNGKKKRNKLIAEIAKLLANYTCQATNNKTFKMPNGKYYVEAHHLIEFSNENGPDITDNLIILGPEKHRLIHLACAQEIDDLYNHLKTNGVINYSRFEKMHTVYKCLTKEHIEILADKKLISSIDKQKLLDVISN